MAALIPNGKQQFIDINGNPLVSGTVSMYVPGTLIPKNTWQDPSQGVLNPNPIVLDSRGQATILGNGSYRQILRDSNGNEIWDKLTSAPGSSPSEKMIFLSNYATLALADAAAVAANGIVLIDTNYTLTTNTICTAKSLVGIGGVITTGVYNLTGNFSADPSMQVFDADGTGIITLSQTVAYASWYGCGTNVAATDTAALKRAAISMRAIYGEVKLPRSLTTNETIQGAVYGTQGVCSFSGNTEYGTIWFTTLTGATAAVAYQAANFNYLGMGIKNVAFVPTNAGPIGARNAGTAILLSGVNLLTFENVTAASMTRFIWGHNEVASQFTEQHTFRGCYSNLCDTAVYLEKTAGDESFRGWNGYITMGVSVGQTGFYTGNNTYPYSWAMTFQGTGFGVGSPVIANFNANVGAGKIDWLLEQQSTLAMTMTLAGGKMYQALSYLSVQGGTETVTGTLGLIPGLNLSVGLGKVGSNRGLDIAADATFALPPSAGGLVLIRNSTSGGTASLLCDQVTGITVISDPDGIVSTTDGGPGSNYWFVEYVGTAITFKNRYAINETADVEWNFTS